MTPIKRRKRQKFGYHIFTREISCHHYIMSQFDDTLKIFDVKHHLAEKSTCLTSWYKIKRQGKFYTLTLSEYTGIYLTFMLTVYLLNIWQCVFILSGAYLLRNAVRTMVKFCTQMCTDHVQNIYWVLYLKGSSLPKKWHFSTKIPECRPIRSDDRSVGWLAGYSQGRPWQAVLLTALLHCVSKHAPTLKRYSSEL